MAFSYQNYTGNNATTTFSIPFTYTDTSEISVTVDGVAETGLAFPSSSEVTLTSAPASGTLVQVRRTTSLTARAVDFASGSVLTEEDLDNSSIQTFHASQEANDRANDAIAFDADGKWDAQNKVIKNLATPTDANDATNKSYVDTSANNAASSAAAALVSQNASAASATASANSATASAGSATTSANEASNSADSATASAASASTASTQATLATTNGAAQVALATSQADNAASSATTAATQATLATTNGAAQVALATTQANLATTNGAAQVALATTQANNAASSASTAATQATASASSATTSATQATNSANSATASANSASSASSAQTAAESARDATLAAYDNFDDRYLGAKSSSPTVDNDGNALIAGSLFFDTTNEVMKIYTGSAWVAAYVTGADFIPTSGGGITGDLAFGDNNKATFGSGNDLQIYHNGSASVISDVGTGNFFISGDNDVFISKADLSEVKAKFSSDGAVSLYYNGLAKLATTATGVDVTGGLNTTGNVGIGTTSPASALHISSNTYPQLEIDDKASRNYAMGVTASTFRIRDVTGAADRLTIATSGNVGIGTASPSSVLHLSTSNDPKITLTDTGYGASADITGSNGNLRLNSTTATIFDMAGSEKIRIDSNGRVGIGTSSPTSPLHVVTNSQRVGTFISTGSDPQVYIGDAPSGDNALILGYDRDDNRGYLTVAGDSDSVFTIANGGNVGIGTNTPDSLLELYRGTTAELRISTNNAGTAQLSFNEGTSTTIEGFLKYDGASNNVVLGTSGAANALVIPRDSGNVGIGTTAPSYKLHSQTSVGSDFAGYFYNSAASGNGTSLVARGGANNSTPNFQVQDYNGNADFTVAGNGNATFSGSVTAAGGFVGAGKVLQVVQTRTESEKSTTSTGFVASGIYVNITPSSTSSKILVTTGFTMGATPNGPPEYKLYRAGTALTNARMSFQADANWNNTTDRGTIEVLDSPNTTSLTTYEVYFKRNGTGAAYIGRSGDKSHPNISTYITAMEIAG